MSIYYYLLVSSALLLITISDGGPSYFGPTNAPETGGISSTMLWITIGVIGGVTIIALVVVAAILCLRWWMKSKPDARQHRLTYAV